MKKTWITIRTVWGVVADANQFIAAMEKKFPEVKFKAGKPKVTDDGSGPEIKTSVLALLPTLQPNDTAREVFVYAHGLQEHTEWKSRKSST